MPDPIVISDEPTGAVAPDAAAVENQDANIQVQGEEQLLAGKYKNVDELIKGYKELEQRMSQPQEDEPEATVDEAEADDEPETRSARELYGEFVGSALEEAGIDFMDMSDRYQQSGQLEEADYGELAKAGFSRDMVDNYLAGLQYNAASDAALTAQEVMQVKQDFGGPEEYDRMVQWASQNLSPEEIQAYDELVQSSKNVNQTRLAVAGLYAQYTASAGREPSLIGGKAPSDSGNKFESTAQVIQAMNDPRYASDPAYRKMVEKQLSRSAVF